MYVHDHELDDVPRTLPPPPPPRSESSGGHFGRFLWIIVVMGLLRTCDRKDPAHPRLPPMPRGAMVPSQPWSGPRSLETPGGGVAPGGDDQPDPRGLRRLARELNVRLNREARPSSP